jgi:hypothetical protein
MSGISPSSPTERARALRLCFETFRRARLLTPSLTTRGERLVEEIGRTPQSTTSGSATSTKTATPTASTTAATPTASTTAATSTA